MTLRALALSGPNVVGRYERHNTSASAGQDPSAPQRGACGKAGRARARGRHGEPAGGAPADGREEGPQCPVTRSPTLTPRANVKMQTHVKVPVFRFVVGITFPAAAF